MVTPAPKKAKWGWRDAIWLSLVVIGALVLSPYGKLWAIKFWVWWYGN